VTVSEASEEPSYGTAASVYWAAGWRGILPLPPRAKASPPLGFTGRDGAYPSRADVETWSSGPEARGNLALRLAGFQLGIDVDNYDRKLGRETIGSAIERFGPLPPTWRSTSRDDGVSGISLYRVPEGLHWPGVLGDGVETITWYHRYAVAWPSTHPLGRPYRWITPDGVTVAGGVVPGAVDLPPLPDAWVLGVTRGDADVGYAEADLTDVEVAAWIMRYGAGDPCPAIRDAVASVLSRFDGSTSRHDAARDGTARLFRLAAEGHVGAVAGVNAIGTAFRAALDDTPGRDYDQTEWRRLYLGAIRLAAVDTRPVPPRDPCAVTVLDVSSISVADARAEVEANALRLEIEVQRRRRVARRFLDDEEAVKDLPAPTTRNVTDELALPEEDVTYRVDRVLPVDANVVLAAGFKAGKTTLVNHLARCLVDGVPLFGRFDVTPLAGRVVIFNYEVSAGQYRRWLRDAGIEATDDVIVCHLRGQRIPIQTRKGEDLAVRLLAEAGAALWIVDPFAAAFVGTSENDNAEVSRFLDALDVIKARAGVRELVLTAHTGRGIVEDGAEHVRGATRLDDWPDARWLLVKDEEDRRYFRASGRDVEVEEMQLGFVTATRQLHATGRGSRRMSGRDAIEAQILAVVEVNPGIGMNECASKVRSKRVTVLGEIRRLAGQGRLRTVEGAHGRIALWVVGPSVLTPGVEHE
jgi:hypothetical protein